MKIAAVLVVLFLNAASAIKIGLFLDKVRNSLSDLGDIVDGAEDVVKYVRSFRALRAAAEGNEKAILRQIEDGFDINFPNIDGTTALMEAASHGQSKMIQLLLRQGAELDRKNKYGFEAYDYAMHGGHEEVIPLLGGANSEALARLATMANSSDGLKPFQPVLLIAVIYSLRRIVQLTQ